MEPNNQPDKEMWAQVSREWYHPAPETGFLVVEPAAVKKARDESDWQFRASEFFVDSKFGKSAWRDWIKREFYPLQTSGEIFEVFFRRRMTEVMNAFDAYYPNQEPFYLNAWRKPYWYEWLVVEKAGKNGESFEHFSNRRHQEEQKKVRRRSIIWTILAFLVLMIVNVYENQ